MEPDDAALFEARARVSESPNDLGLRFQLGRILFEKRRYKDAIAELQRARQNPNIRKLAMALLAESLERLESEDGRDTGESGSPSRT